VPKCDSTEATPLSRGLFAQGAALTLCKNYTEAGFVGVGVSRAERAPQLRQLTYASAPCCVPAVTIELNFIEWKMPMSAIPDCKKTKPK
jgi:hypothetical protein